MDSLEIKKIKEITKKNNSWQRFFLKFYNEEGFNVEELDRLFKKLKKYKNNLSEVTPETILLIKKDNSNKNILEIFNDEIDKKLLEARTQNFLKIFNEEVNQERKIEINEILENYISEKDFINEWSNIKSKNIDEVIKKIKKENLRWEKANYLKKIKNLNVKIIKNNENILIIRVLDFYACQLLAPKTWCITNSSYFFDIYTSKFKVQYIVFDFNKKVMDKNSLIGLTIKPNGKITDAYDRDNKELNIKNINYKLSGIPKEEILTKLKKYDNQKAFDIICETGVDYLFEEYKSKNKYKFPQSLWKKRENVSLSHRLNHPFRMASKNGNIEILKKLLKEGKEVNPSARNNYAIRWAAEKNDIEVLKFLLTLKEVDPSSDSNYPIRIASEYGFAKVVEILLKDKRVDPTANDHYALRLAMKNKHYKIVDMLIKNEKVLKTIDKKWLQEKLDKKKKS